MAKVHYEILLHFFNSFSVLSHFTWPFTVFDVFSTFQLFRYYCFSFSTLYLLPWPDQTFFPLSLSSILTVPSRPLRFYSLFSSSFKKKKNSCFSSLFSLRSTEISRKWKYSEKYNKTEQWKFLVIFPKGSTEISSLPNF